MDPNQGLRIPQPGQNILYHSRGGYSINVPRPDTPGLFVQRPQTDGPGEIIYYSNRGGYSVHVPEPVTSDQIKRSRETPKIWEPSYPTDRI